jgi:tight adherence protein B
MDTNLYLISGLLFITVALTIEGLWNWWLSTSSQEAKRMIKRLTILDGKSNLDSSHSTLLKERHYSKRIYLNLFLEKMPLIEWLDLKLQESGMLWQVDKFIIITMIYMMIGFLSITLSVINLKIAIGLGILIGSFPYFYILKKRTNRFRELNNQLPEVADLIGRSLRAGHAFSATIQMVASEMADPIASEFRLLSDEINYGVPFTQALQNLAKRVPLTDLRYLVIAVLIQRETGGNLAELMSNLSSLMRQRIKLSREVKTLSAEGRISAWILTLLPIMVLIFLSVFNPAYVMQFTADPAVVELSLLSISMMLVGGLWMRKIIHIHS